LARSSPEDKRLLVETFKELGETVAASGDGANDAAALKLANVGFSMGIAGTEVAKTASDIIIMDDSFASMVTACMWGRAVNDAVRKFLQFQLSFVPARIVLDLTPSQLTSDYALTQGQCFGHYHHLCLCGGFDGRVLCAHGCAAPV
jgi:Ca2+-transporting ATPase